MNGHKYSFDHHHNNSLGKDSTVSAGFYSMDLYFVCNQLKNPL